MLFPADFAFDGVAGKLFHPLAFTRGFSLIGAVIASLFFLPAISAIYVPNKKITEKYNKTLEKITILYEKTLNKVFMPKKNF